MLNGLNTDIGEDYFKKRTRVKQNVHFMNVDLEVWSKQNLQMLIDCFGENVLSMGHFEFDNGNVLASFELSLATLELGCDSNETWRDIDADKHISIFCGLIENLPKKARQIWDKSYKKVFDVGFESGNTEKSFNTELKIETLKKVQEIGAGIIITIYPVLQYTIQRKDKLKIS